jgi:hypothetical protein
MFNRRGHAIEPNDTSHKERSCWRAILFATIQQIILLFVAANILDGGDTSIG